MNMAVNRDKKHKLTTAGVRYAIMIAGPVVPHCMNIAKKAATIRRHHTRLSTSLNDGYVLTESVKGSGQLCHPIA